MVKGKNGGAKPAGPGKGRSRVKVTRRGGPSKPKVKKEDAPPAEQPATKRFEPVPERKAVAKCSLCHTGIYLGETQQKLAGGEVAHPGCVREPQPLNDAQAAARAAAGLYKDFNSRTAILIKIVGAEATFVMREPDSTFELYTQEVHKFKDRWTLDEGYPVERAARLYIGYAQNLGASPEAVAALATLVTITEKEQQMAITKKKPGVGTATKTAAGKKQDATKPKAAAASKEKKVRGPTQASRFCDLIMAGKHTDDQIFALVHKDFPNAKRSYVSWYRNSLVKKGQKPPAAKAA
jgi:hypothetical protein